MKKLIDYNILLKCKICNFILHRTFVDKDDQPNFVRGKLEEVYKLLVKVLCMFKKIDIEYLLQIKHMLITLK